MALFKPVRRDRQWHSILRGSLQKAARAKALMRTRPRRIIPFMPASPSKERLESRIYRKRLRPIKPQVDALLKAIDAVAIQRDWPADLRSEYRTVLKNLARKALHLERLDARRMARLNILKWKVQQGARLADTYNLNQQLAWLLNRKAHRNRNLYAMAQGKRTLAKLGIEHYRRIGKLGAQARWDRERGGRAAEPTRK